MSRLGLVISPIVRSERRGSEAKCTRIARIATVAWPPGLAE
jgi:hypothetical protein